MVVAMTRRRPAALCCSMTGPAKGWIIPTRTSAAACAAAWTLRRERPLAKVAAWRASIMLGRFSPTRLNSPYITRSPGIDRPMSPAERMASEKTWPLPPESRVRSRSKNGGPTVARGGHGA